MYIRNVLIADDHEAIIEGIRSALCKNFTIGNTTLGTTPEEILSELNDFCYDLYILDLEFKETSGIELMKRIRKKYPKAKVIFNTMHEEIWVVNELLRLDPNGIVLKQSGLSCLMEAVNTVMDDRKYLCPKLQEIKANSLKYRKKLEGKNAMLTPMERNVLRDIVHGKTTKEIAIERSVTENTIEAHRKNLFVKLGVHNVAHLVAKAISFHLVEYMEME